MDNQKLWFGGRRICLLTALMLVLAMLFTGCGQEKQSKGKDTVGDGAYVLTVDGYGVTEEEFLLFLRDQKAVTANYYWVNYQMQPDSAFWNTEVEGKRPIDFAKERALAAVIRARQEFILAAERGILDYQDYNSMMDDMEAENEIRAEKQANGEVFYGLSEFTPFTYYQYLNGNIRAELEHSQADVSKPTKDQLMEVYEFNKENLTLGIVYNYQINYPDGRTEEISQNTREIGKVDTITEDLIYSYFDYMEPGETVENYDYYGEQVDIVLQSVEPLGYQSFEDAEDSLRVFYARSELSALIDSRAANAEVVFDQARYDALEMP